MAVCARAGNWHLAICGAGLHPRRDPHREVHDKDQSDRNPGRDQPVIKRAHHSSPVEKRGRDNARPRLRYIKSAKAAADSTFRAASTRTRSVFATIFRADSKNSAASEMSSSIFEAKSFARAMSGHFHSPL